MPLSPIDNVISEMHPEVPVPQFSNESASLGFDGKSDGIGKNELQKIMRFQC